MTCLRTATEERHELAELQIKNLELLISGRLLSRIVTGPLPSRPPEDAPSLLLAAHCIFPGFVGRRGKGGEGRVGMGLGPLLCCGSCERLDLRTALKHEAAATS